MIVLGEEGAEMRVHVHPGEGGGGRGGLDAEWLGRRAPGAGGGSGSGRALDGGAAALTVLERGHAATHGMGFLLLAPLPL